MHRTLIAAAAAIAAAAGTATAADPVPATVTGGPPIWDRIDPVPAPPRAQALQRAVNRYLTRQGFPVTPRPVWAARNRAAWSRWLPEDAVALADHRGTVLGPNYTRLLTRVWPPTIETVEAFVHETLHQPAVDGYGGWDLTRRAVEEGRVQAATGPLAANLYRLSWPRAFYTRMGVTYPACTTMVRRAVARTVGQHAGTRAHRSFVFALVRAPIAEAERVVTSRVTRRELRECRAEVRQGPWDETP